LQQGTKTPNVWPLTALYLSQYTTYALHLLLLLLLPFCLSQYTVHALLLLLLLQVRLGPLTPQAVQCLRHLKDFFNVMFDMKTERNSSTIFLTCIGFGLKNMNRKVT
jgi:hypothetical protein